jgi:transposase
MPAQKNNLNFNGESIYVGFDVHKATWQVTILSKDLMLKRFVMPPDSEKLSKHLHDNYPGATFYSAYEAGFSGFWMHYQLLSLGINNIVVNPADIPGTQKDKLQKEDRRDSQKIANALRSGSLTPIYIPSRSTMNDRSLIRCRRMLVKDMTRLKNRIKCFLFFYGIEIPEQFSRPNTHWSRRFMAWLDSIQLEEHSGNIALKFHIAQALNQKKLLKDILLEIKKLSLTEKYKHNYELIKTIPGIALVSGMTLLAEIDDINRFPNEERFASFVGLIPMTHSSGEKQITGEITYRAHRELRSLLVENSWIAIRRDPALFMAFNTLKKRMETNRVIVRIAKKLANRIYAILKNKTTYEMGKTNNQ